MKIAVVGGGVAGLVAAWLLADAHDVTLLEAEPQIGGHARTIEVRDPSGGLIPVDTGFMVYNPLNYPRFTRLLGLLGVETQPTTMSFSVQCARTGLEYCGSSARGLFADPMSLFRPRFLAMVRDIFRFHREAQEALEADDDETVGSWCARKRYSAGFVEDYLVPIGSSIWSCAPGAFREYSIRFAAEFFHNHRMLQVHGRPVWRTIVGGSVKYVSVLGRMLGSRVRTGCRVDRVHRNERGVLVSTSAGPMDFDHVVLALHGDAALRILADPVEEERSILGRVEFSSNQVVIHSDLRQLPRRKAARAAWNFRRVGATESAVQITYCMNTLQRLDTTRPVLITLNPRDAIAPEKIDAQWVWRHPARRAGPAGLGADRLVRRPMAPRTSYCGAYWGWGFHEDGVLTACEVAQALGGRHL